MNSEELIAALELALTLAFGRVVVAHYPLSPSSEDYSTCLRLEFDREARDRMLEHGKELSRRPQKEDLR